MRNIFFTLILFSFAACNSSVSENITLETNCDSIHILLDQVVSQVKPGIDSAIFEQIFEIANQGIQCDSQKYNYYFYKVQALASLNHYQEALETMEFMYGKFNIDNYQSFFQKSILYNQLEDSIMAKDLFVEGYNKLLIEVNEFPDSIQILVDYVLYSATYFDNSSGIYLLDSLIEKHPNNQLLLSMKDMDLDEVFKHSKLPKFN